MDKTPNNYRAIEPQVTSVGVFVLCAVTSFLLWNDTVFATDENVEFSIKIPYKSDTIAKYRLILLSLERTGDEFDTQLPNSDNWLICDEEYVVFQYEMTELAEGYLPPLSATGTQLFYATGEATNAMPHEEVTFRLNESLSTNQGLLFFPVPETTDPPELARFSYSIREEVPEIYGGSKSVRILEIGEVVRDLNAED